MAEDLGVAQLRLTVDPSEAIKELGKFQQAVNTIFGDLKVEQGVQKAFQSFEKEAAAAGTRAGNKIRKTIESSTSKIKFKSLTEALDFKPENTIKGIRAYIAALKDFEEGAVVGSRAQQQLRDRIKSLETALRESSKSTSDYSEELLRLRAASDKVVEARLLDQLRQFKTNLKESEQAAAKTRQRLNELATAAVDAGKAVASVAGKGAIEAIKLPIFGLPKGTTDTFSKIRAQIERLQQQSETASGKVARLSEGLAFLGTGGFAAKGIIDSIGGVGAAAQGVAEKLAGIGGFLDGLPSRLAGFGGLSDIFNDSAASLTSWAQSLGSTQDLMTTLTGPMQAVTSSLAAIGPEAAVVGGALAFTFAGFQDLIAQKFKPGIDGARQALKGMTDDTQRLLEALARLDESSKGLASLSDLRAGERDAQERINANPAGSAEAIAATQDLLRIQELITAELREQAHQAQLIKLTQQERKEIAQSLRTSAQPSNQLALPSTEILNPEGRGINRLQPGAANLVNNASFKEAKDFAQDLLDRARRAKFEVESARELAKDFPDFLPDGTDIFKVVGDSLQNVVKTTGEITAEEAVQEQLAKRARQSQLAELRTAGEEYALQQKRTLELKKQNEERAKRAAELLTENTQRGFLGRRGRGIRPEPQRSRSQLSRDVVGSAIIGGAFPLLFGQGIGASLGGGLGGGLGGLKGGQFGFGLSLVGTAIGAQFDAALQKGRLLGEALNDPIAKFGELAEAGLISSKAMSDHIAALIESGKEAQAAAEIQLDLAKTFGDTSDLQELDSSIKELFTSFAQLGTQMVQFIAGPVSGFIKKLAQVNGLAVQQNSFNRRVEDLGLTDDQRSAVITSARERARAEGDLTQIYRLAQEELDRVYGKQQNVLEAEEKIRQAIERHNQIRANTLQIGEEQIRGDEKRVLELQKQNLQLEQQQKLAALPANAPDEKRTAIAEKYGDKVIEVERKLAQLADQRFIKELRHEQAMLATLQERFRAQAGLAGLGDAGKNALGLLMGVEIARQQERIAQAELRAAPGNRDLYDQAQLAAAEVKTAAIVAYEKLTDAFRASKESVRNIQRSIEDTVTALNAAKGGADGVNKFITEGQRNERQLEANAALFKEARAIARQLGVDATFSGSLAERNAQMADFISAGRNELRAPEDLQLQYADLAKANNDLTVVNAALVDITKQLSEATLNLANKDWNVYVNGASTGSTGDMVSSINRAL